MDGVWHDESVASWGRPGAPVLPRPLRDHWKADPLPGWVVSDLGLPSGATFAALDADALTDSSKFTSRLQRWLKHCVASRRTEIESLLAFPHAFPSALRLEGIPWRVRTWTCLSRAGLLRRPENLVHVTFGDLFRIRAMGALSVLDASSTAEAVVEFDRTNQGPEQEHQDCAAPPKTTSAPERQSAEMGLLPPLPIALFQLWGPAKLPEWSLAELELPQGSTGENLWKAPARPSAYLRERLLSWTANLLKEADPSVALARISHHLTVEARNRPAITSLRFLAVLNVLSSTPPLVKRRAPRTDVPLTHFASPRGEKSGLARAFPAPWVFGVNLRRLPWRNRTRTCLEVAGLLDNPDVFGRITIGELAKLKNMGVLSIVDAIAVGEAFLDRAGWSSGVGSSVKPNAPEAVESRTVELSQQETEDLFSLLDESWASQVSEADPRFADVMPATGYGTILERIDQVVTAGGWGSSVSAARALLAALPQIKQRLQELDAASLGDSLRHYLELLCGRHPNRATAMAIRLGWGETGHAPRSRSGPGGDTGTTTADRKTDPSKARTTPHLHASSRPSPGFSIGACADHLE